ncbi:hypothetical protein [Mesorhizobium sp. RIZ17]|uniref:hypothetical protein n=1 Tax=Mesorhizobium sp. RIZ17 TaxID=3132743 RepID=UPI003DA88E5F
MRRRIAPSDGGRPAGRFGNTTYMLNKSMLYFDTTHVNGLVAGRLRVKLTDIIAQQGAPFPVTGAASLFRIHVPQRMSRDVRHMATNALQYGVRRALCRFLSRHGAMLPNGAAAGLSTPMGETEVDYVRPVPSLPQRTRCRYQKYENSGVLSWKL